MDYGVYVYFPYLMVFN